jgi:hypothetical protein
MLFDDKNFLVAVRNPARKTRSLVGRGLYIQRCSTTSSAMPPQVTRGFLRYGNYLLDFC